MAMLVTLVDKDGNECLAGSAVEANDLLAAGYRYKQGQSTAKAADKPAEGGAPAAEPAKATTTVNTDQSGTAVGGGK